MSLIITDGPRGLGYFELDHRATPAAVEGPRHFEADTYTCSHCQFVVVMNPARKRERYKCKGCNHHICDGCEALKFAGAPCKTYAQKVDEIQERDLRHPELANIILP